MKTLINVRELNTQWTDFERCAEDAPEGAYDAAKRIADVVADASNGLLKALRDAGLRGANDDRLREVEAVIYGYIKESNPDSTVFPVSEGFGASMSTPARERVIAQATANVAALRLLGVVR